MRHISKSLCPEGLAEYLSENPDATWKNFGDEAQEAHEVVQNMVVYQKVC